MSILFRQNYRRKHKLGIEIEGLQEKINLAVNEHSRELKNQSAVEKKILLYKSLKDILEKINRTLDLNSISEILTEAAFTLIANNKGSCVLYLVDNQTYKLGLFKTKKEDKNLIIKAKEGDIFDLWVLRHASPLLIEDIRKDFRFDPEKFRDEGERFVSSVISAPLISDHKFLGILRLDNPTAGFYQQHDLRFLVTICDLVAVALENSELFVKTENLAIHDSLTSLYTRGYFLERLREELKRSARQNKPFSLLMLDIDYFKKYNDKFGHTAGDEVLRSLSRNLCEYLKDLSPIISRFGGEEFCIAIPHMDKKEAYDLSQNLCASVEKTKVILRRQETGITVSIGIAAFPHDATDIDDLITKADRAMYEAKKKGRNRPIAA
ncbi:MAG: sensor domain-containing diguanylate cyclase [Candidatus Omnitrophica bacterium]|nr:sensor domain-containing diguanylate cyclase [Candidatus Omnitrophota bacterium]